MTFASKNKKQCATLTTITLIMKISKFTILTFLVIFLNLDCANSAIVNINNGASLNVSGLTSGDTANFLGISGTLVVDDSQTLASVTAANNQSGTINFSSADSLTISGNIGTTLSAIQNITFNTDGILIAGGDINTGTLGTSTTVNNQGNITLSGAATQNVSALIGSSTLRLNTIAITQGNGAITFSGNVFANNLTTSSAGGTVIIGGVGSLNFSNAAFAQNTTINSSGTNSFGATTISDAKTLTLNSDTSLTNLTFGTSGNVVLATGKTATITGNISGTGIIKGSATNEGIVLLSGSDTQNVGATVKLGDGSNRLNKISISNISVGGVVLNNDAFTTTLDFTNTSGAAQITIASGKEINVSGNIAQSGTGGTSLITGAGKVNLSGSTAHIVGAKLGSSSSRLGELVVSGAGGATLNQNAFLSVLNSTGTGVIINNATLDASAFNVAETTSVSGTGTNSFGATTISDSKNLTLNSNASLTTLSVGTSSNLILASGKTATITGDISGAGLVKGSSSGLGNVTLSGSSVAQNVAAKLGDGSNRLNQISISNIVGVNFNNDVFTTTLNFTNVSGASTATIASGKTLNVSGDITQSGAGTSIITGSSGIVSLSGSSAQTVDSGLGSSTSDRLGQLIISNASGVTLSQDAFLTTLTFTGTGKALTIASPKLIDVASVVDLSGQTLNVGVGASSALFGRIKSGDTVTVDGSTTINFDYSNNSLFIDHGGITQFDVAESTSGGISGTVSDIVVTDNSFLFNNALLLNGNKIVSTISKDTTNFDIDVLGSQNFTLLDNALEHADLTAGIISISSQAELDEGLATLKPSNNQSIVNISSVINDAGSNIALLRLQQMNNDSAGFSADGKKYKNHQKIWGQFLGGSSVQKKIQANEGYKATNTGLMFGADKIFSQDKYNMILGSALAYNRANISNDIDGDERLNKNSISSYQAIFYNNNSTLNGLGFYNNNIVNLAYNQYTTTRNIILGSINQIAQADFDGYSYSARSDVGYNFKLADNLLFAPNVGLKYFSLTQNNYQEKGAGNNGLKVSNQDFHSLASEIGFNITSKFADEYFNYIPKFNTSWEHSLNNNNPTSTFSFIGGGTEMKTDPINIQENKFNVGLAINISDESDSSLQLQYNLQLSTKFISNSGSLQYRYVF